MTKKNGTTKSRGKSSSGKAKAKSRSKTSSNGKKNSRGNKVSKSAGSRTSSGTSNKARFIVSPYTNEKVYIAQATIKDLKSSSTYRNDGKRLWTITSEQIRYEHYQQLARIISNVEQNLIPSSGMRSWQVEASVTEPNGRVLFRPFKGKMELAVAPHLIDKIPDPPVWPGKRLQPPDEYEAMEGMAEDELEQGLADREISALSSLAWDELRKHPYNYSVPQITCKWKSPDGHKTFTSRTAAWDHAKKLCEKEVIINRFIEGIGPSGKKLQPVVPSLPNALKAGQLRFIRDGLWVVGQELSWQDGREEELEEEKAEAEANATPKVYRSGLEIYIATNRQAYRDDPQNDCSNLAQADRELRIRWRALTPLQQQIWVDKCEAQFPSSDEDEEDSEQGQSKSDTDSRNDSSESSGDNAVYVRPSTFFLQAKRQKYRAEQQCKLDPTGQKVYTLAQADRDLMKIWNKMSKDQKKEWLASQQEEEEKSVDVEVNVPNLHEKQMLSAPAGNGEGTNSDNSTDAQAEFSLPPARNVSVSSSESGIRPPTKVTNEETESKKDHASTLSECNVESSNEEKKSDDDDQNDGDCNLKTPPTNFIDGKTHENLETAGRAVDVPTSSHATSLTESKESPTCPTLSARHITANAVSSITPPSTTPTKASPMGKKSPTKKATPKAKKNNNNGRFKLPTEKVSRRWCLDEEKIELCKDACMEHYEAVMRTVKQRNLLQELEDGFDVMRERGRGRFDMTLPAFDEPQFDFLTDPKKTPWMPVVRAILGDDAVLVHKGCFLSLPGAEKQVYHQDGVHLNKQTQRPCHAINVFVPLVDLHSRNGPTEFVLGSHILGQEGFDKDFSDTPMPNAGTPVIFDYRLGHRGLGNSSDTPRPILYTTYSSNSADGKTFVDSVNFSKNMTTGKKYHKIGDLSAKPLSREERRNNRKRSIELREEEATKEAADPTETSAGTQEDDDMECHDAVSNANIKVESPMKTMPDKNPSEAKRAKKPSVVTEVATIPVDVAKAQGISMTSKGEKEAACLD